MSLARLGQSVDAEVSVRILGTDRLSSRVGCNVSQIGLRLVYSSEERG